MMATLDRRPRIKIDGIKKAYRTQEGKTLDVLRGLDLEIYDAEFVSLIGPSGGGKTTLLNIMAGLVPATSGRIIVGGEEVQGPSSDLGLVFQEDCIFLWRTVLGNVEYGPETKGLPRDEVRRIAMKNLDLVGLRDFASFYPKELSGGMKKRVALAMVLANDPAVLLMDEPFGSLDYQTKVELQLSLLEIWENNKKTTVFVTHDIEEALFLSDRVVVLTNGLVAEILEAPFGRPRANELRTSTQFAEAKIRLWNQLKSEERAANP